RRGSGIVASSARNGSSDFKATSDRFGRLTQIQTFSPSGIVRHASRIKILKTVASGTQLRALNSPACAVGLSVELSFHNTTSIFDAIAVRQRLPRHSAVNALFCA